MLTLELFAGCAVRAKAISKGVAWLNQHRSMVESWADDLGLDRTAVVDAINADLAPAGLPSFTPAAGIGDVTIVVPCYNYGHFLQECLQSIDESFVNSAKFDSAQCLEQTPRCSDSNQQCPPQKADWTR